MKTRHTAVVTALALGVLAALGAGGYALYATGMKQGMARVPAAAAAPAPAPAAADEPLSIPAGEAATRRHIEQGIKAGQIDPANGKPILYYHDPMSPGKRFDAPGKSPFMDMMLVPVYGGGSGAADSNQVSVSPRMQQSLGLRTAEVVQGRLRPQASAIGSITWNERDQSVLQARAAGFVEKLYVRATLDRVAKGQPVAELYVPEWVAAQEEFLSLRRAVGGDAGLASAARQRMALAGMSEAQIATVERSGTVVPRITLVAPSSGVVAELAVREGMTVMPGATLVRINGLGTVWAVAEVPESQVVLVRPGTPVQARSPGVPDRVFSGRVQAVLPEVNPATRTIKVRVELANPGARLSPGMFVTMQFTDTRETPALLVPTEAVIHTGKRAVVMLADEGGRFRPVEIETGIEADGQTEVRRGLQAGQRVVVSSQFLIDSEASLKGVESRLNSAASAAPAAPASAAADEHAGHGPGAQK